jgi:hypothetical protein
MAGRQLVAGRQVLELAAASESGEIGYMRVFSGTHFVRYCRSVHGGEDECAQRSFLALLPVTHQLQNAAQPPA